MMSQESLNLYKKLDTKKKFLFLYYLYDLLLLIRRILFSVSYFSTKNNSKGTEDLRKFIRIIFFFLTAYYL